MKHILILELILIGASLACVSLMNIPKAVAQEQRVAQFPASRFDGLYLVEVVPESGSCTKSRWTAAVAGGQIASVTPNPTNITALGLIESNGVVSLTFRDAQNQIAHVGGMIKGRRGKGSWSSPTLLCGGIWRAQKQK